MRFLVLGMSLEEVDKGGAFMKKLYVIAGGACVGCASCEAVCPVKAVRRLHDIFFIDETKCVGCGRCEKICRAKCIFEVEG